MKAVRYAVAALIALASLTALPRGQETPRREIALTFDDLPASQGSDNVAHIRRVAEKILAALTSAGAPAVGFVNEGKLGDDEERDERIEVLRMWIRAGVPLGNHTRSHPDVNTTPLETYQQNILDGDRVTSCLMADARMSGRWFRHPFTHTGPTKEIKARLDAFLLEHGYRVAPFTIENADYVFSHVYRRSKGLDARTTKEIADAYLAHTDAVLDFIEPLARETFGRDISHILLIHANDINADHLPAMLDRLKRRGYRFVTPSRAMEDEAYRTADGYVGRVGPSWIHRWRVTMGLPSRLTDEPDPPAWVMKSYQQR